MLSPLRSFFLLALLLPLSACFVTKKPAESEVATEVQVEQKRAAWLEARDQAIGQLRQNPHLSITDLHNGDAKIIIRSGNIFNISSMQINPQVRPVFEHIVTILNAYPQLAVRIIGHSDNSGGTQQNLVLSIRRAESARDALVSLGLDANRVSYDGRGDAEPIAPNTSAEGRAVNRRIDLLIQAYQMDTTSTQAEDGSAQTIPRP